MSTGPQGQQGQQGAKGPRGVVGATGWGYGKTTGPTGAMGFPQFSNMPASTSVVLSLGTVGTIFQTTYAGIDPTAIQNADTGAFWTIYNPSTSNLVLTLQSGRTWSSTGTAYYTLYSSNSVTVVASGNSNVFVPM